MSLMPCLQYYTCYGFLVDMTPSSSKRSEDLHSTFFKAVQHNDVAMVQRTLQELKGFEGSNWKGVNSLVLKKSGDTALHILARLDAQFQDLFRYLVEEEGANIAQINIEGKTPFHDAAQFENVRLVQYLIDKGANVNVVKRADWTPLMLACTKRDNVEVIRLLLQSGATPFFVNKDGWNCCHIASREGNSEVVKMILDSQPTASEGRKRLAQTKSRNGRRSLHAAVTHGHLEVTALLVNESDADEVNAEDHCGTTPLMEACRHGHGQLMEYLLGSGKGCDLNKTNKLGQNCLHIAAENGQSQMVEELIVKHGMDANLPSKTEPNMTPVHWAAKEGQINTLKTLFALNADFTVIDSLGRTVSDISVAFGHLKSIQEHGIQL